MAYTLTYTLINNNTEYQVSGYTGDPVDVIIPSEYNGYPVTSIGDRAFKGCDSLTRVVIPDGVTSIGYAAFYECKNLTSIEIPDSVTSIDKYAFDGCNSLTSIEIPDSVTSIDYAVFHYCSSLTSVVIPDSVTSIGSSAFDNCSSLTSIVIPDNVTSIGERAFSNCSSLTSITVSENNTKYKSIDGNLYSKDGKTLIQYAIGKTATSFTVPDSVTSIGSYAFYNCDSLTSVVIPDSVTSIGDRAFWNCDSLKNIVLLSNTPASLEHSAFSMISTDAKFYCYSSSLHLYKTATNWNIYADKFVADDLRLYFVMNANNQKKYFVSKQYTREELNNLELYQSATTISIDKSNVNTYLDLYTAEASAIEVLRGRPGVDVRNKIFDITPLLLQIANGEIGSYKKITVNGVDTCPVKCVINKPATTVFPNAIEITFQNVLGYAKMFPIRTTNSMNLAMTLVLNGDQQCFGEFDINGETSGFYC